MPSPAAPLGSHGGFLLPAGQEGLVAAMLGRGEALPGGCVFRSAAIGPDRVTAAYDCGGRTIDVALVHPSEAPPGARPGAMAALVAGREAPDALVEALSARIRSPRAALTWIGPDGGARPQESLPSSLHRADREAGDRDAATAWIPAAGAIALVVVPLLIVLAARRPLAARAPSLSPRAVRWAPPVAALLACAGAHAFLRGVGAVVAAPLGRSLAATIAVAIGLVVLGLLAATAGAAALRAYAPPRTAVPVLVATAAVYLAAGLGVALPPPAERGFGGLVLPFRGGAFVEPSPRRPRVTYQLDRLGFRERELTETKAEGVTRVVLVGDSYVFGSGVERDGTLSSRLEEELGRRPGGDRAEVLNLGVPGHNVASHVDLALAAADRLHPDVVVVCLTLPNDLSRWDVQDELREASRPGLFALARFLLGDAGARTAWALALLERRTTREGIAHLRRQIARLAVLRERRTPRVVFFRYTPLAPEADAAIRAEWPGAAIVAPRETDPTDAIPGDGHPTASGNARFAALIAAELARTGPLGAAP